MPTNPTHKDDVGLSFRAWLLWSIEQARYNRDARDPKAAEILTAVLDRYDTNTRADREADDSPAIPERHVRKPEGWETPEDNAYPGGEWPTPASHTAPDALREALQIAREYVANVVEATGFKINIRDLNKIDKAADELERLTARKVGRGEIARIVDPNAWVERAFYHSQACKDRRDSSLAKADAIASLIAGPLHQPIVEGATDNGANPLSDAERLAAIEHYAARPTGES